jgi:hypothetical protein
LERYVAISEKEHQVGGFGDLPNVNLRAIYAIPAKIMMDWAAAKGKWATLLNASE